MQRAASSVVALVPWPAPCHGVSLNQRVSVLVTVITFWALAFLCYPHFGAQVCKVTELEPFGLLFFIVIPPLLLRLFTLISAKES